MPRIGGDSSAKSIKTGRTHTLELHGSRRKLSRTIPRRLIWEAIHQYPYEQNRRVSPETWPEPRGGWHYITRYCGGRGRELAISAFLMKMGNGLLFATHLTRRLA